MNTTRRVLYTYSFFKTINWKLLVFLLMFMHVKLVVKLAALIFIFLVQPNFRFGFALEKSRLPIFYPFVIVLAFANSLLYQQILQFNYLVVLLFGIALWVCCLLASHQLKLIVEKTDSMIIYRTLVVFFIANMIVSLAEYASIMMETGYINPFLYQGNYQKYFINTGDYIKGISFDTSTTNAVINAFGVIFFLYKRSWKLSLACVLVLLLTASNLVNLLLFLLLFVLLIFKTTKEQKSLIVLCFALLVTFVTKISPQNNQYVTEVMGKMIPSLNKPTEEIRKKNDVREMPDSLLSFEERKEKIARFYLDSLNKVLYPVKDAAIAVETRTAVKKKPLLPVVNIHTPPYQNRNDTDDARFEILNFIAAKKELLDPQYNTDDRLPGKAETYLQTLQHFKQEPEKILTGSGLGNFSSKTAFKATGLKVAGSFPKTFQYINADFAANHLALYLNFFSKPAKKHSITNSPNSVYDQLLGEYGIIGMLGFVVFYLGFFLRTRRQMSYSIPLLFLVLGIFFFDYWFEQLSVVALFELLYFFDIKENQSTV